MKKRNRKNRERRKAVRAGPTPGVILIPADYGKDWLAALKGEPADPALAEARNVADRLLQGELGEVVRTTIVPTFERVYRDPAIDPMTGHPWAFPFHFRRLSLDEFKAMYPVRADIHSDDPITEPRPTQEKAA